MYGWKGRIGLLDPSVAYKLAQDVNSREAEGIFISCTNFRTIEIIEALEKNLGKPVVTSNQASMAMVLRLMGIREKIIGFGALLEKGSSLKDARYEKEELNEDHCEGVGSLHWTNKIFRFACGGH